MTKVQKENVIVAAVVVSVLLHVTLMLLVRSQVMTSARTVSAHRDRRPVTRIERAFEAEDVTKLELIRDIMAAKDAPKAEVEEAVLPVTEASADKAAENAPNVEEAPTAPEVGFAKVVEDAPAFDVTPLEAKSDNLIEKIEVKADAPSAPRIIGGAPSAGFSVGNGSIPDFSSAAMPTMPSVAADSPSLDRTAGRTSVEFKPSDEVYKEIDERIVEREKDAVRELLNADAVQPLEKFVTVKLSRCDEAEWIYFKATVTPLQNLETIPKDVVILLDASGSIGSDRLSSCTDAARKILRSSMNSDDRFNLVAFRDRFAYAFRTWQSCNKDSFAKSDKWLGSLASHGRTDVFSTIRSMLTLPRDPKRPMIALVVTDGDANYGVSNTSQIIAKFSALNDGLISVYMYGVKSSANIELIDVLTRGNRGESFVFDGWRWNAGKSLESLSDRFRDPVLSDLRIVFASSVRAEAYPTRLKNLYRGESVTVCGRAPKGTDKVAFSLKGLNGERAYEGFFSIPLAEASVEPAVASEWRAEKVIDSKLHLENK